MRDDPVLGVMPRRIGSGTAHIADKVIAHARIRRLEVVAELVRNGYQSHAMGHTEDRLSATDEQLEGLRIPGKGSLYALLPARKILRRSGSA